jgi:hypothetical protein
MSTAIYLLIAIVGAAVWAVLLWPLSPILAVAAAPVAGIAAAALVILSTFHPAKPTGSSNHRRAGQF